MHYRDNLQQLLWTAEQLEQEKVGFDELELNETIALINALDRVLDQPESEEYN